MAALLVARFFAMKQQHTSAASQIRANRQLLARLLPYALQLTWIAVAILAAVLFADSVGARYEQLLRAATRYERVLADLQISVGFYAAYLTALDIILILAHVAIAMVIFWRAQDSTIAIFVALALVATPLTAIGALESSTPLQNAAANMIRYLGLATSVSLLYLFPDGRFVPRWTRSLAFLWALLNIPAVFFPNSSLSIGAWPRSLQAAILLGWAASGVYAQVFRYLRVSTVQERRQTRWAILGLTAAVLGPFGYHVGLLTLPSLSRAATPTIFYNLADPALFSLAFLSQLAGVTLYGFGLLVFPLSLAISVLRYHLFDIEIVVNRTLVYTALTGVVVGLYILVVGGLGRILQAQDNVALAILAAGLIAVLFHPLRQRLQQAVNRLMYGDRDNPVAILSRLGERLENTSVPEATLPTLVETIAQTLKLPYVALVVVRDQAEGEENEIVATHGRLVDRTEAFALGYRGQHLGQLLVAPRAPGETFTASERRLLQNIARQAGAAVYAYRLTRQLQRSRQRLVTTREEERRRLRRDLHDGLGPRLATLTLKVDTARNYLQLAPQAADALLVELKDEIQEALQDVRRMAYALRPPALDQLGLVPALIEFASKNSVNGLRIAVDLSESLPRLPAAVEVAAYRIALEAMTNVVRHAHATRCTVRLSLNDVLHLEITDDGVGFADSSVAGVGLASMRERAAELGGSFDLQSAPEAGTRVLVRLPLRRIMS